MRKANKMIDAYENDLYSNEKMLKNEQYAHQRLQCSGRTQRYSHFDMERRRHTRIQNNRQMYFRMLDQLKELRDQLEHERGATGEHDKEAESIVKFILSRQRAAGISVQNGGSTAQHLDWFYEKSGEEGIGYRHHGFHHLD